MIVTNVAPKINNLTIPATSSNLEAKQLEFFHVFFSDKIREQIILQHSIFSFIIIIICFDCACHQCVPARVCVCRNIFIGRIESMPSHLIYDRFIYWRVQQQ